MEENDEEGNVSSGVKKYTLATEATTGAIYAKWYLDNPESIEVLIERRGKIANRYK